MCFERESITYFSTLIITAEKNKRYAFVNIGVGKKAANNVLFQAHGASFKDKADSG